MSGRDPDERHRASTPLELLFDLTVVVSFGVASDQLGEFLAHGHVAPGVAGFVVAMIAICWAWVSYSWFASAYDTDDWAFRLATMVVMVGVLIVALGLPAMFASVERGNEFDNRVMVAGYVVMRVAMVAMWLRAAHADRTRRLTCLTYAGWTAVAQFGWVAMIIANLRLGPALVVTAALLAVEVAGPLIAEIHKGATPWHAHHIAERYGLLLLIALGEGVVGTIASLSAVIAEQGWSVEAVLVAIAGTGLTFGMWWVYFALPSGPLLHRHRGRAYAWAYLHIPLFMAVAATGAGLQVAGYVVSGEAELGEVGAVAAVAGPIGVFLLLVFVLYALLVKTFDSVHIALFAGALIALAASVLAVGWGAGMGVALVIIVAAPLVVVVGYETVGVRHQNEILRRLPE